MSHRSKKNSTLISMRLVPNTHTHKVINYKYFTFGLAFYICALHIIRSQFTICFFVVIFPNIFQIFYKFFSHLISHNWLINNSLSQKKNVVPFANCFRLRGKLKRKKIVNENCTEQNGKNCILAIAPFVSYFPE